jgi:hypothetical protein
MNVQLKDITVIARDGRVSHLDQVYIRGSHVRFFIVPDMLTYGTYTRNDEVQKTVGSFQNDTNIFGIGMLLCSDREINAVEVWVWREDVLQLTGREVREVEDRQTLVGRVEENNA